MKSRGSLKKMAVEACSPVAYWLRLDSTSVPLNALLGRHLGIRFEHRILCVACGRETKKSFANGFCFPCFRSSPENAECIIRPELCRGHLGEGRDREWERRHHAQPHCVYLALSSQLKVGVTRTSNALTRWIDQGASAAIVVAETPHRRLAGDIEVALKPHFADRTDWRRMLTGEAPDIDLATHKAHALELLPGSLRAYASPRDAVTSIGYPMTGSPRKPKSVNLEKAVSIDGTLTGMKAQYLIFADDTVINIRRHAGYVVTVST